MQIKRNRCDMFRTTTDISNADQQQNCIDYFAARDKLAKPACTYSAASQAFQPVILLYHIDSP